MGPDKGDEPDPVTVRREGRFQEIGIEHTPENTGMSKKKDWREGLNRREVLLTRMHNVD